MLNEIRSNVTIIEVGPRDGLQNESVILETEIKYNYIKLLLESGLKNIEVSSFVRPEKIPQMQDCSELSMKLADRKNENLIYLVPNLKGLSLALNNKVKSIAVFTATSETFNKKNINATIEESINRITPVIADAKSKNIYIRGYLSTVFGCPYEGKSSDETLLNLCKFLIDSGVNEISLGDTIGAATPLQVKHIVNLIKNNFDLSKFAFHFHDTKGMAVANVLTAFECGASRFDSSSGGLGGCPYADGATGNVATEDLIYLFDSMGVQTGIDINKLVKASRYILQNLKKESTSKYFNSL